MSFATQVGPATAQYAQRVTVAKQRGDFDTIQAAIDSITDASSSKRYLVRVMPGTYSEQVTMKSWVDVRGAGKHCTRISFTGNNNGSVILADFCQIEDILVELSTVSTEFAIVGTDVGDWHIRNVDILAATALNVAQGIKITGDNWTTGFIEHSVINYVGTTGRGILIQGNSTTPQMADCHMNDVFVDSLAATTGGAIEVIDCRDVYLRNALVRTNPAQAGTYALKTSRAAASTTTYVRVDNSVLEGTNANGLVVSASTTVYWYSSTAESMSVSGTLTSYEHIIQTDLSCEVHHSTTQALTTAVWTALNMDSEKWDRGTFHDTVTNNTRLTAPVAGRYLIHAVVQFAPNATGTRHARLMLNGATAIGLCGPFVGDASIPTRINVVAMHSLAAGDYVEIQGYQNSGGNLNSESASDYVPRFGMVLLK